MTIQKYICPDAEHNDCLKKHGCYHATPHDHTEICDHTHDHCLMIDPPIECVPHKEV